jgi:hypothetical protein
MREKLIHLTLTLALTPVVLTMVTGLAVILWVAETREHASS